MRSSLKVAGVPEHFNSPWHLALKRNAFADKGLDVEFTIVPEGTGAMTAGLRSGKYDVAIALTEGLVADLSLRGTDDYAIIAPFVLRPLNWGIFVAPGSEVRDVNGLKGARVGVSRMGSGSHIMAGVLADKMGWGAEDLQLGPPAGGLPGLVRGLTDGSHDWFMWEYFTVKPELEQGHVRMVGNFPTPWPCFLLAARRSVIESDPAALRTLFEVILDACRDFKDGGDASVEYVSERHRLSRDDARSWLGAVEYGRSADISGEDLEHVIGALKSAKVITSAPVHERLVSTAWRETVASVTVVPELVAADEEARLLEAARVAAIRASEQAERERLARAAVCPAPVLAPAVAVTPCGLPVGRKL